MATEITNARIFDKDVNEALPVSNNIIGDVYISNNGSVVVREESFTVNGWVDRGITNSAASLRLVATDLIDSVTATLERVATVSAAGVLTTFTDSTPYNVCSFIVSAITTSITVEVSNDGLSFSSVNVKDVGDSAFKAVTAVGVYELSGKFKVIRFTAVGAGTATAQFLLGVK